MKKTSKRKRSLTRNQRERVQRIREHNRRVKATANLRKALAVYTAIVRKDVVTPESAACIVTCVQLDCILGVI